MRILFRENGVSRIKVLVWLVLLFAAIHIAVKLVPMYMDYWGMEDEIKARVATAQDAKPTDDEILASLTKKAKDLDLPLGQQNFIVTRNEERHIMKISTAWDVEVHFFWDICGAYCVKTYHFQPSAEGPY